mmetsp:Transcript_124777/g.399811  ORF Transcript_124777/g.399811 Transcript_124777/m.399811 type:complete len:616 (-) Transcript_124777:1052-2899(-)
MRSNLVLGKTSAPGKRLGTKPPPVLEYGLGLPQAHARGRLWRMCSALPGRRVAQASQDPLQAADGDPRRRRRGRGRDRRGRGRGRAPPGARRGGRDGGGVGGGCRREASHLLHDLRDLGNFVSPHRFGRSQEAVEVHQAVAVEIQFIQDRLHPPHGHREAQPPKGPVQLEDGEPPGAHCGSHRGAVANRRGVACRGARVMLNRRRVPLEGHPQLGEVGGQEAAGSPQGLERQEERLEAVRDLSGTLVQTLLTCTTTVQSGRGQGDGLAHSLGRRQHVAALLQGPRELLGAQRGAGLEATRGERDRDGVHLGVAVLPNERQAVQLAEAAVGDTACISQKMRHDGGADHEAEHGQGLVQLCRTDAASCSPAQVQEGLLDANQAGIKDASVVLNGAVRHEVLGKGDQQALARRTKHSSKELLQKGGQRSDAIVGKQLANAVHADALVRGKPVDGIKSLLHLLKVERMVGLAEVHEVYSVQEGAFGRPLDVDLSQDGVVRPGISQGAQHTPHLIARDLAVMRELLEGNPDPPSKSFVDRMLMARWRRLLGLLRGRCGPRAEPLRRRSVPQRRRAARRAALFCGSGRPRGQPSSGLLGLTALDWGAWQGAGRRAASSAWR